MKKESTITLCIAIAGALNTAAQGATNQGNVLVIVADDLGKEMLSIYDTPAPIKAKTPNIDRLAKRGVVFDNVWGAPLSAPVRAAMLTGRYGHHTGIVALNITLPLEETTLFEALPEGYSNAVIGKWHLSDDLNFAPDYGIDHFAGIATEGGVRNYYRWQFTVDGQSTLTDEYATTQITNSAKEWIDDQTQPWVCWVAYNAPHIPLHIPPSKMHSQKRLSGDAEDIKQNPLPYYLAMIEALDYDIGRLLESVDKDTTIIFIGDNGTEKSLLQAPYSPRHGKGSLYESGVAIPMIVCGGEISTKPSRSEALVSAVDIFPTVMELAGVKMSSYEDGYSFLEAAHGGETLRKYNFADIQNPRQGYMNAIGDGRYKLITYKAGNQEFYDTEQDPLESQDLLQTSLSTEENAALKALTQELTRMNIPYDSLPETKGATNFNRGQNRQGGNGGNFRGNYNNSNNSNYNNFNNNNTSNQYRSKR